MARGGLLGLAAVLLLGVLFVVGQPRRDTTPELGDRIACAQGQPLETGTVLTCFDLAACASADIWEASPPPISATTVYTVQAAHAAASGDGFGGVRGYVVVFDLADGGQRRVQISLLPQCPHASG